MRNITKFIALTTLAIATSAFAGDTIWGIDNSTDKIGTFNTDNPSIFTPLGSTTGINGFINSLEFDGNGNLFVSNGTALYSIDRATGVGTFVGNHNIADGSLIADFAWDSATQTMYGMASICGISSSIYTIDLNTGAATFVCDATASSNCDVSLAFDGKGNAFTQDIVSDTISKIDVNNCTASTLLALPFDANFGQGFASNDSGLIYHVAFNATTFQGELYSFTSAGNDYTFLGKLGVNQIAGADLEQVAISCLDLTVDNLIGGQTATLTVSRGTPGERVVVAWGKPGSTESTFDNVNGWCATFGFDIKFNGRKSNIIKVGTFDQNGILTIIRAVSTDRTGLDLLLQAAERNTCPDQCMSNIIERVIG